MDNPGKALAALRRQHLRTCVVCGELFYGLGHRRYCNKDGKATCRNTAKWRRWWIRHREYYNARRRKGFRGTDP